MNKRAVTDEDKKAVLDELYDFWVANPEMRLGQMLVNGTATVDLFYVEDFTLLDCLKEASWVKNPWHL